MVEFGYVVHFQVLAVDDTFVGAYFAHPVSIGFDLVALVPPSVGVAQLVCVCLGWVFASFLRGFAWACAVDVVHAPTVSACFHHVVWLPSYACAPVSCEAEACGLVGWFGCGLAYAYQCAYQNAHSVECGDDRVCVSPMPYRAYHSDESGDGW